MVSWEDNWFQLYIALGGSYFINKPDSGLQIHLFRVWLYCESIYQHVNLELAVLLRPLAKEKTLEQREGQHSNIGSTELSTSLQAPLAILEEKGEI